LLIEEALGELFVAGDGGERDVFDGVAKGPVADVVEERGDEKSLGIAGGDGGDKARVVGEAVEEEECQTVDAEGMFEAGMVGGGVDEADQAELADAGEAAELGGVDEALDARGDGDVEFGRDADEAAAAAESGEFGDVAHGERLLAIRC